MAERNIVIQFICYTPRIYSGFDKYNLELARVLTKEGYNSVFVFADSIEVKPIIDDLIAEGVTFEFISSKNKLTILIDVVKLFYKYKPAVVHAHFENYVQLLTAILSFFFGSNYFISFHSIISLLSVNEYKKKKGVLKLFLLKFYYKFLLAISQNVLCVSRAIKYQFCAFTGSDSAKIQCLYLGVKIQPNTKPKNQLRSFLSLPDNKILLCNVSAIEPIKGLDILIKAIGNLKTQYNLTNFKCCHIGGSRSETFENVLYRTKMIRLVKELQLENEFLWLGQRNDIDEILAAFDIYVHPSRMEGLGVAIMEACAQSLPVVGTFVGGIPEIINQGNNGFLFSSESADELAGYLNLLINDKELCKRMGSDSYRIVNETFNLEKQTQILVDFYLTAINDRFTRKKT